MKTQIKLNNFSRYAVARNGGLILRETNENIPINNATESYELVDDFGNHRTVTYDEIVKMQKCRKYVLLNDDQKKIVANPKMTGYKKAYLLKRTGLTTMQIAIELNRNYETVARDLWRIKTGKCSIDA